MFKSFAPLMIAAGRSLLNQCRLAAVACLLVSAPLSAAPGDCPQWVARIVSIQGHVEARAANDSGWTTVALNDPFCQNDIIHVGQHGRAALELNNETVIRLDQLTTIVLTGIDADQTETSWLELLKGAVHFITRVPRSLKIKTPYVNASVEGTEFVVRVDEGQTRVSVIEGKVVVENEQNRLVLEDGQSSISDQQTASRKVLELHPQDAVAWSLYYPALLEVDDITDQASDAVSSLNNAHRLLVVGRVDEAETILAELIRTNPGFADAYALRSIIKLTQGKPDEAEQYAKQALQQSPRSVTAWLANSYVLQAHFEHEQALASIQQALALAPDNYIALTRQAELLISLGRINEAATVLDKAIEHKPDEGRAYTLTGFVKLQRYENAAAKQSFEQGMQFDQADPLPRLGLGLSQIREGRLKQGRRTIEIAALLHPVNALIRSYLGKAYYEEFRDKLASEQFVMAKQLDPRDPTPWFYDAILKQRQNNPGAALNDIQNSINRNDNRAVYRSRLLLDEDLAARNASLARIYQDLDFNLLALNEGWQSASRDPANHSAHRFLADSYASLPRHEIARVSELLQAQLLQPLNLNPIQPQLSASNLGILDGAGPSTIGSHEFNPLFTRNRTVFQTNLLSGNHDTNAYDIMISGLTDRLSYSIGEYRYRTDGYRPNNDQDNTIKNFFIQNALNYQSSLQFEYRRTELDNGDLSQMFDSNDYSTIFHENSDADTYRLGYKHEFTGRNILLASVIRHHVNLHQLADTSDSRLDELSNGAEVQLIQKHHRHHLISGAGFSDQNQTIDTQLILPPPACSLINCNIKSASDRYHSNAYLYSYHDLSPQLNLTLGLSVDDIDEQRTDNNDLSQTRVNPKLGLIWQLSPDTAVRAAAFRTVNRTFVTYQTIEPTHIAGFNQYYEDLVLANAERYGLAFDKSLHRQVYTGLSISHREIDNPYLNTMLNLWLTTPTTENELRAYSYWTVKPWLTVTAEVSYEEQDTALVTTLKEYLNLDTLSIPIGITMFTHQGMRLNLTATHVNQQIDLYDRSTTPDTITPKQSRFNIVDAELSLQMPHNYGRFTLVIKNITDKQFQFRGIDNTTPSYIPERHIFMRLTLNLS